MAAAQVAVSVRDVSVQHAKQLAFRGVSFDLTPGQALAVIGGTGSGKSTLLRTLVGCLSPASGDIRIHGLPPRHALQRVPTAYFAGEATLPGFVRASAWGTLGTGELVLADRRRIRALSRSTRQLLGLRTVLGRHPLALIVLDEPWEGLDVDATRWLAATLESKRDRGATVILSSHRLHDLAGLCDKYLFLLPVAAVLLRAHEIAPSGSVTGVRLEDVFDALRCDQPVPRLPPERQVLTLRSGT